MTNKSLNHQEIMLSYCLKCRRNTEKENLQVAMTQNGRLMGLQKFAEFYKKSNFLKEQEARE